MQPAVLSLRKMFFLLLLMLVSAIGLQSCYFPIKDYETRQQIRAATHKLPDVAITSVAANREQGFIDDQSAQDGFGYSLARISDTSFVFGVLTELETAKLQCFNKALDTLWISEFPWRDDEYGIVWYRNTKLAVVSQYLEDDTLFLIGRHFNVRTGKLLDSSTIAAIPMEDDYWMNYRLSPDSSQLTAVISTNFELLYEANATDKALYTFIAISPELTVDHISSKEFTYVNPPSIIVGHNRDIFCNFYSIDDSSRIRYDVVRLRDTVADTLTLIAPSPEYTAPNFTTTVLDGSAVQIVGNQIIDDETRSILTGICDFTSRKVSISITPESELAEFKARTDEGEFEQHYLFRSCPMPEGKTALVFYQNKKETRTIGGYSSPYGSSPGSQVTDYSGGSIVVVMLDAKGKIVWQTFLKRSDNAKANYVTETHPACFVDSQNIYLLYRNWDKVSEISYAKVSLTDGASTLVSLPAFHGHTSTFVPGYTLFNSDKTAILFRLNNRKMSIEKALLR